MDFKKQIEIYESRHWMNYIKEAEVGKAFLVRFLLISASETISRKGFRYLVLKVSDGQKAFDIPFFKEYTLERLENNYKIVPGDLIEMELTITEKRDFEVFNISKREDQSDEDKAILTVKTKYDVEEKFNEIIELVDSLDDKNDEESIASLTKRVLNNNKDNFLHNAAAISYHHDYIGGLLEHSYNVMMYVNKLADVIEEVDRELLVCGAVLHDIGKTKEIVTTRYGASSFSKEGALFGHLYLGAEIVRQEANAMGFKSNSFLDRVDLLCHIIASHHGNKEYGAIMTPAILEAEIIYRADDIDAKRKMYEQELLDIKNGEISVFSRSLKKYIYNATNIKKKKNIRPLEPEPELEEELILPDFDSYYDNAEDLKLPY